MIERILVLSESRTFLQVHHECLQVRVNGTVQASIPLSEVTVIVADGPETTFTQPALAGLAAHGGTCVLCDEKHHPVGMILPLQAHHLQVERFARQARVTHPTRKRLWQTIVKAKILSQDRSLVRLDRADALLPTLANKVRSGDPTNIEAQAARRYWPLVFDNPQFRRDRKAGNQNRFLNYGYAVLRAMTARAICAAGLHPGLGLHHHNRYSTFPLADDLMEPFRSLVDVGIAKQLQTLDPDSPLDATAKRAIIQPLLGRYDNGTETRSLWDWLARPASSLEKVFSKEARNLDIPAL